MDIGHLLYLDGMIAVTLGLPTLLVAVWARDALAARQPRPSRARPATPFIAANAHAALR